MGYYRNSDDSDMLSDFALWAQEFKPLQIIGYDKANMNLIKAIDPKKLWLECSSEATYLEPLVAQSTEAREFMLSCEPMNNFINQRFYLCEVPFEDKEAGMESWILTGAPFRCEGCQDDDEAEADPNCSICSGEGSLFLSIYDEEMREDLDEYCELRDVTLPDGFEDASIE